jgi:glutamate racemase
VRPNQLPCGTCSRGTSKLTCRHYPMLDNEVLEKLRAKKEVIDQDNEAHRIVCVCEHLYGGDWHTYYGV